MTSGPAIAARNRRRLFGSLCSLVFLVNLARVVFAPLLEPLGQAFEGLTVGALGLVATLVWVGSALPRLPTGYLLTKVARHRVVLGTGIVLTVAAATTAEARTPTMLFVGAVSMGLASGAYFIAANPLVSELYPDRVGRAVGVHGTASQLAAVGAPVLVTGVLALSGWRDVFRLIAVAAAVATLALYLIARRSTMPAAGSSDRDILAALRAQWPLVLTGIAIIGATGFVWNGVFNFYVSYLKAGGMLEGRARTMLTLVFAAGVPAFWATGRLADRVPNVPLMLAILASFAGCLFVLTLVSGPLAIAAISLVIGYVIHSLFPAIDTYMLGSLPDEHRGSAYAVYSGTMMLVQATGSVVLGVLLEAGYGFDAVFRLAAGGLVVVLAVLVVLWALDRLPDGHRPA